AGRRTALHLAFDEPDDVALGIGEVGEGDHVGDDRARHDRLTAPRFDLAQVAVDVVDLHVERQPRAISAPAPPADPALTARAGAEAQRPRHDLRPPVEHALVELPKLWTVGAEDLEVDDLIRHVRCSYPRICAPLPLGPAPGEHAFYTGRAADCQGVR